jgi:hypothetical protein
VCPHYQQVHPALREEFGVSYHLEELSLSTYQGWGVETNPEMPLRRASGIVRHLAPQDAYSPTWPNRVYSHHHHRKEEEQQEKEPSLEEAGVGSLRA